MKIFFENKLKQFKEKFGEKNFYYVISISFYAEYL
jgi:hypothetical protein